MSILLTGGTGYIGSHTAIELIKAGYEVVIADNLSNSQADVVEKIQSITSKAIRFYQIDVADVKALNNIFSSNNIDAIIHFAGFKAVGESVEEPVKYYRNNIDTTLSLLEVMKAHSVHRLIFSSSATVYGEQTTVPVTEEAAVGDCANPYGRTKFINEQILTDWANAEKKVSAVILRYFNPIGAHESGTLGEQPNGIPNNLMPYITQTAAGIRERLNVYGNDYDTTDGTGVRDYIHVVDLARGHIAALKYAEKNVGAEVFNLGTGSGYSVLEMVKAFEKANDVRVPYSIASRRPGDIAVSYAGTEKAERMLGWKAEKTLEDMCRDSWRWQQHLMK